MKQFILLQFRNGQNLVHAIFDNPERLRQTPNYFNRKWRDATATIAAGHTCDDIQTSVPIPSKWRADMINCHTCKHNLLSFFQATFSTTSANIFNLERILWLQEALMVIYRTLPGMLPHKNAKVLKHFPDLCGISKHLIPQTIQAIFVVTGYDYASFFSGIRKATFMM